MNPVEMRNLSNESRGSSYEEAYGWLEYRIRKSGKIQMVTDVHLDTLRCLGEFALGRYLIEKGGLNGFWTDYIVTYPARKSEGEKLHMLESELLNKAPTVKATQERFAIFKNQIQMRLKEGGAYASIPCGLMGDLLELDYKGLREFSLHGVDLDPESLDQASKKAEEKGLKGHCAFSQRDAWNLGGLEQFDLISSNGLTIYEPDDRNTIDLYHQFRLHLKPEGVLVTSFLTPPSEWIMSEVNAYYASLQQMIFTDILQAKWQQFRTEAYVREQLQKAHFGKVEVIYDRAHIFPTVIATKETSCLKSIYSS